MPLVDAVNEIDWSNEPRSIPLLEPAAWGYTTLGVLLAVSVLTSHLHDPTLFNQLSPSGGVRNALSVGGALIGGTLVELFGGSAVLLAWLVARLPFLNRMAAGNLEAGVIRKAYYAVLLTWMVAVLAELVQARHAPEFDSDWLWYHHGYLGEITAYWLGHSIGPVVGIGLCLAVAMFAAFRIIAALNPWPLIRTLFQIIKLLLYL
ncbi:MAG: DNA translocase FtsK 4TM domain-containing protein, partial [SAR324 cluster bacterium]|nr:DNA translocase FtsK 4TM domain-containing protein [SAR324 cluster bacterium]